MISFSKDQRFIVTGASSGIGEGVALLLNELGATVIGIGRNRERLESMQSKATHPENVYWEQKDLTRDIDGLVSYVRSVRDRYGLLSGMVYCAGVMPIVPIRIVTPEILSEVFSINVFAPILMMRGLADKRNNVGKGTSAVFISSASSIIADKGHSVYGGSKAALNTAVRVFAKEVAPLGIRANCILPTSIKTENMTRDFYESQIGQYPLGFGTPEDVAHLAAFLLSHESKWITGQTYVMDCASF